MSKGPEVAESRSEGGRIHTLKMPSELLPLKVQLKATGSLEASSLVGSEIPLQVELLSQMGARCRAFGLPAVEGAITLHLPWAIEKEGPVVLEVSGLAFKERRRGEDQESLVVRFFNRPVLYLLRKQGRSKASDYLPLGTPVFFAPSLIEEEAFHYYKRLARTRDHVAEHCFARAIQLAEIAAVAGMELTYFSDFFRQKVGISFRDWLQQIRLAHALELLVRTNQSVTYVALESGFPSLRAFERTSRKYLRMAPAQFKKLIRPC